MGVEALLGSLVLLFPLFEFSTAIDSITATQNLQDGQTLISTQGSFELGFFSPRNSTNRYVGIWYHNISEQTIVWVANRENPVNDSSGILTITNSGDLVVLDGSRNTLWSTNVTNSINTSSVAELFDSGNLILREANSDSVDNRRVLWQTFDHPSDTFLPMMRLGISLKTGEKQTLNSWKTPSDPSIGVFSIGINPNNLPQVFIWNGPQRYWRSGPWNGRTFIGVPAMDSIYLNGFNLIIDNQEERIDISYAYYNVSFDSRFVLDTNGSLEQLRWDKEEKAWIVIWGTAMTECDIYGECGPFGTCNPINLPICSCLRGYEPKSIDEWSKGDWSGGCVRKTKLQCERNGANSSSAQGKGDGFLKLEKMKLPDYADWFAAEEVNGCEDACSKNCSCVAYAYDSGIGCMFWSGDLMDMQVFAHGGEELHIRLAKSELGGGKRRVKIIILIAIILGIIILCLCGFLFRRWMAKRRELQKIKQDKRKLLLDLGKSTEGSEAFSDSNLIRDGVDQGKGTELPLFEFGILAIATNNFSDENKLGQGGFGPVYKGKLPEGREIAVKRLSRSSRQGLEEFKNEVVLISKLQHRNLVRLLGCCIEGEEKMLVYEFMENNSLDAFLFDPIKRMELDWPTRFQIVEGIARGLLYLHRDSRLKIIHRDLKASNILLDKEMNPKISDFGMARIFGGDQIEANTIRVVGTYGYMSPEYAMEGQFSEKSDVFSFGVLLLEIVSGTRNTGHYHHDRSLNLLGYTWRLWNEATASSLVDYVLGDSFSQKEALRCIHVGLLCVQEFALDRPTMSSIVFMLGSEGVTLPTPKQPAFTQRKASSETGSNRGSTETVSINNVSITVSDGGR